MNTRHFVSIIALTVMLAACGNQAPAPVSAYGLRNETEGGVATAQNGETVYDLSRRFRLPVRDVIELNNLEPPYRLAPGQRLRLPRPQTHVVARGDTPDSIARTYGVSQSQLIRLNGLSPDQPLPQGQELRLPHAGSGLYDVAAYEAPSAPVNYNRDAGAAIAPPDMAPPTAYDRVPLDNGISSEALAPQPLIAEPLAPTPMAPTTAPTGPTPPTKVDQRTADWLPPPALPDLPDGPPPGSSAALAAGSPLAPAKPALNPLANSQPGLNEPRGIDLPPPSAGASPIPPSRPPGQMAAAVTAPAAVAAANIPTPEKPAATPAAVGSGRLQWPLKGKIVSPFGPKAGGGRNDGINIATSKGTPVQSAAGGTVVYAGNELRSFGYLVLINHGDNLVTAYGHLDSLSVKRGQSITPGQVIGKAGQSGSVDSPQLHFEVRRKGKPVDPMGYLKG